MKRTPDKEGIISECIDRVYYGTWDLQGGNDFEIYGSPKTIGHTVVSPADTMAQCRALFFS